jgi:hypothetical protein
MGKVPKTLEVRGGSGLGSYKAAARVWRGQEREDGGDSRCSCRGRMAWIQGGPRLGFGHEREAWWPRTGGVAAGVTRARQHGRCEGGEALGAGARAGGGSVGTGCGTAGGGRRES